MAEREGRSWTGTWRQDKPGLSLIPWEALGRLCHHSVCSTWRLQATLAVLGAQLGDLWTGSSRCPGQLSGKLLDTGTPEHVGRTPAVSAQG